MPYFNHRFYAAQTRWERRAFGRHWWRLNRQDKRAVPPPLAFFQHVLQTPDPILLKRKAQLVHMEALARRKRPSPGGYQVELSGFSLEMPVATAILHQASQRPDTAYLTHFCCVNDRETFRYFLNSLREQALRGNARRLIGPVGLVPHLSPGLLLDNWHLPPPMNTPYNPPYLPELIGHSARSLIHSRLYHLDLTAIPPLAPAPGPANLIPLRPFSLVDDYLPLLQAALQHPFVPPPDAPEARFMLNWLQPDTLSGWLAKIDDTSVGFVLLQADHGDLLQRTQGGQGVAGGLRWRVGRKRPSPAGRLVWAAVLPPWRGQGIGQQLLWHAIASGRAQGWHHLTIGPIWQDTLRAAAIALLDKAGAIPHQTYELMEWPV